LNGFPLCLLCCSPGTYSGTAKLFFAIQPFTELHIHIDSAIGWLMTLSVYQHLQTIEISRMPGFV